MAWNLQTDLLEVSADQTVQQSEQIVQKQAATKQQTAPTGTSTHTEPSQPTHSTTITQSSFGSFEIKTPKKYTTHSSTTTTTNHTFTAFTITTQSNEFATKTRVSRIHTSTPGTEHRSTSVTTTHTTTAEHSYST